MKEKTKVTIKIVLFSIWLAGFVLTQLLLLFIVNEDLSVLIPILLFVIPDVFLIRGLIKNSKRFKTLSAESSAVPTYLHESDIQIDKVPTKIIKNQNEVQNQENGSDFKLSENVFVQTSTNLSTQIQREQERQPVDLDALKKCNRTEHIRPYEKIENCIVSSVEIKDSQKTAFSKSGYLYDVFPRDKKIMERILPGSYPQDSSQSITKNNHYDFENLSEHEIDVIISVLKTVFSDKYVSSERGIGFANEVYSIVYKPRYILNELLIELFKDSNNPLDQFAVATAYQSQGALKRQQAISYYEKYLQNATQSQKSRAKQIYVGAKDQFLFNSLSELYEREHIFDLALNYAIKAEKSLQEPIVFYPVHIAKILIKIDPSQSVEYLNKVISSHKYSKYQSVLSSELDDAIEKRNRGYIFRPRAPKQLDYDEIPLKKATSKFMPDGEYYSLWHKHFTNPTQLFTENNVRKRKHS